jgi:hypothetical protein
MSEGPDLSEFIALSKPRRLQCAFGRVLADNTLNAADRASLDAALNAPTAQIPHTAIARWLQGRGIRVSDFTVGRHRRHECSCDD